MLGFPAAALAQEETPQERSRTNTSSTMTLRTRSRKTSRAALSSADLHELEAFYNEYAQTLQPVTGGRDFKSFLTMLAKGGADFDMSDIFAMVLDAMLERR